jgi:glycosyltransferase involved in cell wall biosynthesis
LASSFDQQIVSSPLDKEAIGASETLHVIPNGVNIEDFPYTENGREDSLILFTGRMGYFPNAEAAIYFATRVFPLILQQKPDARFLIVGADPPRRVRRLSRLPGVEVTGYVPRIQDYLARATVAVAPMQAGTGIQNKVLEAMASGVPVVATRYALGGIEAVDGEHLLVADDADGLADQVVRLLRDPALRRRLARNARQLVEEKYTWERSVAMVEEVYRLAIDRKGVKTVETPG